MNSPAHNILAIVGRPNVGKSALFNRIVGRRVAIVHEEAGVTRDRISATAYWRDKPFEVVDTGGIAVLDDEKVTDFLAAATRRQAEVAVEMASAIIMVVDVTAGVTPLDIEIARKLRTSGKKIFLAVNKVDNDRRGAGVAEFAELGFDAIHAVAAIHGLGVSELLDAATEDFTATAVSGQTPTRVAIVGRPNVGKSSLINCILKVERTIVSEVPGTTRDSVDVPFNLEGRPYVLVDTAGLRHRRKIRSSVDQFGLMRAERSIRQCDIAVLVLDAQDAVTNQDKKIAGQIVDAARGCVIFVNKWDLVDEKERSSKREGRRGKGGTFRSEYLDALRRGLFFMDWAPVLFASAKTGEGVGSLFGCIARVEKETSQRMDTPQLNRLLGRALDSYPPPLVHGKRFKILYAYQSESRPPTVTLFVNDRRALTPHYERFLTDRIRAVWSYTGHPVLLKCRQRERQERPRPGSGRHPIEKKS